MLPVFSKSYRPTDGTESIRIYKEFSRACPTQKRKLIGSQETLEFRQVVKGQKHPWRFLAASDRLITAGELLRQNLLAPDLVTKSRRAGLASIFQTRDSSSLIFL